MSQVASPLPAHWPQKNYFKISEVARLLEVKPSVIRYWEKEFSLSSFKPALSKQRVYSVRDLAVLHRIRRLLYDERYTIAGAREKLRERDQAATASDHNKLLQQIDAIIDILP